MADWKKPQREGRALGIAFSDYHDSFGAGIAEVSVDRKTGKVNVHDYWIAADTGIVLQPDNVRAQIERQSSMALSAALREELTVQGRRGVQLNFHDYPVLRMNEVPKITTKVIVTDNKPGGIGELGLPPVAPAMANAVFKLTGKRLRDLPFKTETA